MKKIYLLLVAVIFTVAWPVQAKEIMRSVENVVIIDTIPSVSPMELKLYPNPAVEFVKVRTDTAFNGKAFLYNIRGKKLLEQNMKNGYAQLSLRSVTGRLVANEIFAVVLTTNNGKLYASAMFVKQ